MPPISSVPSNEYEGSIDDILEDYIHAYALTLTRETMANRTFLRKMYVMEKLKQNTNVTIGGAKIETFTPFKTKWFRSAVNLQNEEIAISKTGRITKKRRERLEYLKKKLDRVVHSEFRKKVLSHFRARGNMGVDITLKTDWDAKGFKKQQRIGLLALQIVEVNTLNTWGEEVVKKFRENVDKNEGYNTKFYHDKGPNATKRYRDSLDYNISVNWINTDDSVNKVNNVSISFYSNDCPHFEYVEYGWGPAVGANEGRPSIERIEEWVRQKSDLRRSIIQRELNGQPYKEQIENIRRAVIANPHPGRYYLHYTLITMADRLGEIRNQNLNTMVEKVLRHEGIIPALKRTLLKQGIAYDDVKDDVGEWYGDIEFERLDEVVEKFRGTTARKKKVKSMKGARRKTRVEKKDKPEEAWHKYKKKIKEKG